jgi:hypothetical protein
MIEATKDAALRAVLAAVLGGAAGWTANAMMLGPRVDAIEKGQERIELLMVRLLEAKGLPTGGAAK